MGEGWRAGDDDGILRFDEHDQDLFTTRLRGRVTCEASGETVMLRIEFPRSGLIPEDASLSHSFPRSLFRDEQHIGVWFDTVCAQFAAWWYRMATFETAQFLFDEGILAAEDVCGISISRKALLENHLKATEDDLKLRLLRDADKPKPRGQPSKWTALDLEMALEAAVRATDGPISWATLYAWVKQNYSEKAPKDERSFRQLCRSKGFPLLAQIIRMRRKV